MSYNIGKEITAYPTEPSCLIRKRIGELRRQHDTWYDVNEKSDENALVQEMKMNVQQYILPYFNSIKCTEDILNVGPQKSLNTVLLGRLILYGELRRSEETKIEYQHIIGKSKWNPAFLRQ